MSVAGELGRLLGRRLRQVGEGFAEGARQARSAYSQEIAAELRRRAAPAGPPAAPSLDPRIAGYYANLELEPGADLAQVTRAWKKLMRDFHPDRFAADPARQAAATRLVQELSHAHRELIAHLARQPGPRP